MPHLQNLDGRKVSQHQWHITLAFLGSVTEEIKQCVIEQASLVRSEPFELKLDVLGHWSRPRVIWLGCSKTSGPLSGLVKSLNQQLAVCDYVPEHKEFKTHMTLMRKVTRKPKPLAFNLIRFQVKEFVLVESTLDNTGSHYNVVKQWSLRGIVN